MLPTALVEGNLSNEHSAQPQYPGSSPGAVPGVAGTPHCQGLWLVLVHRTRTFSDELALPEDARSGPR